MASVTVKLSKYASMTVNYTIINNDTTVGVTVQSATYTNSRSTGTTDVIYLDLDILGTRIVPNMYLMDNVKVAKGTKSKSWTFNKTTSGAKTHYSTYEQIDVSPAQWDSSYDEVWTDDATIFSGNVIKSNYPVAYNANGGSGSTAAQTKWYGESLALQANGFSRSGYSFARWNTNAANTGTGYAPGYAYTGNAALTLYAIWNRTVAYDANGGSGPPASQTAVATSAITLPTAVPTRAGWRFKSWNTASDGTGTAYAAGGSYPANYPSTTLYAQWERIVSAVQIGEPTAIRTASRALSAAEADEGTCAVVRVPLTVKGAAKSTVTVSAQLRDTSGGAVTTKALSFARGSSYSKPETEADFATSAASGNDTVIYLGNASSSSAAALDVDATYVLHVTVSAANTSTNLAVDTVTAEVDVLIPPGYFTMDVRKGGHGVSFGAPATEDAFNVAMPPTYKNRPVLPYITVDEYAWTSANLSYCKAAVADYRPCVARFSNGAVVEFDDDPSTDAYV